MQLRARTNESEKERIEINEQTNQQYSSQHSFVVVSIQAIVENSGIGVSVWKNKCHNPSPAAMKWCAFQDLITRWKHKIK